jgi:Ni/Fe-hydrogenase 1 B-type cytochrome subunit
LDQYDSDHPADFDWILYHSPHGFRLFDNMDTPRMIHFAMAYVLCFGVVGRVYYAIAAKDAKNIVFSVKEDTPKFPSMIKYYLFLANTHPYYGKYNPGQKMMYTGWLFMALIQIITGFILYKPDTFAWLGGGSGRTDCHQSDSLYSDLALCFISSSPCLP